MFTVDSVLASRMNIFDLLLHTKAEGYMINSVTLADKYNSLIHLLLTAVAVLVSENML